MHRFFAEDIGERVRICGDDFKHISRVLRLKRGDALTLCDGRGMEYEARIEAIEADAALCRVGSARPAGTEPPCRVTLCQCLPKGGKLETVIQKCTELGVYAVQPVLSRRCVSVPADFSKRLPRLNRVACEAAKQSRRGLLPEVRPLVPLEALRPEDYGCMLVAYEEERALSLKAVLRGRPMPESAALVIGPEGGFEASEVGGLTARGAVAVSLGRRILRCETAGPAMLAQLLYEAEP
ncbi:MAG: RsmE family RNA methyltransferase [Clostridia bacterium]|nr:RsmE family RNA methyltransferase [Clostridia bacterium]